jgi:hypothetical protein
MQQEQSTCQRMMPNYLDIPGALEHLISLGFKDLTLRQVRRMADEGVLPFFIGFNGTRSIEASLIDKILQERQAAAIARVRANKEMEN